MNGPYLHLAINHIPVIVTPVATFLLAVAFLRQSRDLAQAGFLLLILVAVIVYPTQRTGGMAAFAIRSLPGIERARIHDHAEAADWALWPAVVLGFLSLIGIRKAKHTFPIGLTVLTILGSIFLTTIMVRVAHLGGLVRHPEIAEKAATPSPKVAPPARKK